MLHVHIVDLEVQLWLSVVNNLIVDILFGASFMNLYVRSRFTSP